jgi:hypothetical protein
MRVTTYTDPQLEDEFTEVARLTIKSMSNKGFVPSDVAEDLMSRVFICIKPPSFFGRFWERYFTNKQAPPKIFYVELVSKKD